MAIPSRLFDVFFALGGAGGRSPRIFSRPIREQWVMDSLALGPHGAWIESDKLASALDLTKVIPKDDPYPVISDAMNQVVPWQMISAHAILQGLREGPVEHAYALDAETKTRVLEPLWARSFEAMVSNISKLSANELIAGFWKFDDYEAVRTLKDALPRDARIPGLGRVRDLESRLSVEQYRVLARYAFNGDGRMRLTALLAIKFEQSVRDAK